MRRGMCLILGLVFTLAGGTAHADVWDIQGDSDNNIGTDNDLIHGTVQRHDLVAHDARFGDLAVKSVAVEPATGFSFDTPGVYKAY